MTIYERALDFVADGAAVGLGSGRASTEFIKLLGARVRAGLARPRRADLAGIGRPGRRASASRSSSLEEGMPLALTVDGADEVDPHLNLIKGYGRALVREKIVAAASRKLVILVGPGKDVPVLGTRGKLPVEVVPFALPLCLARLRDLGLRPVPYEVDGKLVPDGQRQRHSRLRRRSDRRPGRAGSARSERSPASSARGCFSAWPTWCWSATTSSELVEERRRGAAVPGRNWTLAKEHEPCNWA